MSTTVEVVVADRRSVGCDFGEEGGLKSRVAIPVADIRSIVMAQKDEDATCHLVMRDGPVIVVLAPAFKTVRAAFDVAGNGHT